jgi:hypothetical protein
MGLPCPDSSFVVVSEANATDWMGNDVRSRPQGHDRYGTVTRRFFKKIVTEFLARRVRPLNRR